MDAAFHACVAYIIVDALCFLLTETIAMNLSRDSGSELQVRFFFLLLTANLVFVVFDAIWAILLFARPFGSDTTLLSLVNGINLTAISFIAYFWLGFTLAYFENKAMNSSKTLMLTGIPAGLVIVLHAISFLTGQGVIFHPDGTISYGFIHLFIDVVPLLYLLAATTAAIRHYRISATKSERRMALVFIAFMIPPAMSAIVDMFIPNTPIAAAGIMASIVFVMMSMQKSRISNDMLTSLNNRRRAEEFLETHLSHVSTSQPLYLFIIDLDRFKAINDTYGHLEGDHALRIMADSLRSVCAETNAFAARWGGDEFIVICYGGQSRDPQETAELIQDKLVYTVQHSDVSYTLSCTVGYAKCDSPEETSTHLVAIADEMLYRNKQASRK